MIKTMTWIPTITKQLAMRNWHLKKNIKSHVHENPRKQLIFNWMVKYNYQTTSTHAIISHGSLQLYIFPKACLLTHIVKCAMDTSTSFLHSQSMINNQPNITIHINHCLCLNNISTTDCVYQLYIITSIPHTAGGHSSICS